LSTRLPGGISVVGGGYIPDVGAEISFENAETIYTYDAGFPDTSSLQGLAVAIKSTNPETRFILFNVPLSLMHRDAAYAALDQALADLGANTVAQTGTQRPPLIQSILDYLYHNTTADPHPSLDTNHDGQIDLRDAVQTIHDQM
jgi:hypothetical protein